MSIRVLIVDDHKLVCHGLSHAVGQEKDMTVVGCASDGRQAVTLARELAPDIILMDISLPSLNGIDATRLISLELPKTRIIGLSMHKQRQYFGEILQAGASGYLLKDCDVQELILAIRQVASGKSYLSPTISEEVIESYAEREIGNKGGAFTALSGREREVLQLLTEGNSIKRVGQELKISPKTVESHRLNIANKLKIDNVAKLTKYAIREGITVPQV